MDTPSHQKIWVFCILISVYCSLLMIQNSEAHPSVASKGLRTNQNQSRLKSNNNQYIRDEYDKQYSPNYSYHEEDEPLSGRLFLFDFYLFL